MRFTGIDPVAGELFCEEVAERIRAWGFELPSKNA
jgi:hypothetical protein